MYFLLSKECNPFVLINASVVISVCVFENRLYQLISMEFNIFFKLSHTAQDHTKNISVGHHMSDWEGAAQ